MKRYLSVILLCFIFLTAMKVAANPPGYYYKDASHVTIKTIYDGKGEVIGRQEYVVTRTAGNWAYGKNTIIKPGEDSETTESAYQIDGTKLSIYMGKNESGQDVVLDYGDASYMANRIINQANFETTNKVAGKEMKISCSITSRKVVSSNEVIKSEAGQWNCIRTEYDVELRGRVLGIGFPVNVHVIEWFAPGVGIVRTDIYRKGKLQETRLLTGFRQV